MNKQCQIDKEQLIPQGTFEFGTVDINELTKLERKLLYRIKEILDSLNKIPKIVPMPAEGIQDRLTTDDWVKCLRRFRVELYGEVLSIMESDLYIHPHDIKVLSNRVEEVGL